ncbi:hypothetical protein B296_00000702 [Ensete ventricosum]|uniref:Uncharacterized protein n=1 Tax=Ensete ventricosum TaxID=4639 RepID=A0A427B9N2_ENSVE|nr:hypothetical protein B296_00000702 [Ensete ventricosum]
MAVGGIGCNKGVAAIGGRWGRGVRDYCSERLLLVAFCRKGSLLAAIKEDGSQRSLLVTLCSEGSLLDMTKLLLVAIKADGSERCVLRLKG